MKTYGKSEIADFIKEEAPHGSGINYDYENVRISHNRLLFENAFDCMDENGFYDGAIPFRVSVGYDLIPNIHFVGLNGAGWYRVYKYSLREYLEYVYHDFFQSAIARYSMLDIIK